MKMKSAGFQIVLGFLMIFAGFTLIVYCNAFAVTNELYKAKLIAEAYRNNAFFVSFVGILLSSGFLLMIRGIVMEAVNKRK